MSQCKLIFFLFCFLIFSGFKTYRDSSQAWFLEVKFIPTEKQLQGIALQDFKKLKLLSSAEPTWVKVTILTNDLLTNFVTKEEYKEFQAGNISFEKHFDLNQNHIPERFLTGVYEAEDGSFGKFLAIFEKEKLVDLFHFSGVPGFSAVIIYQGKVGWTECMYCDDEFIYSIKWADSAYGIEFGF